jgi:hypothetical protein
MTNLRPRMWAAASALALAGIITACDEQRSTEPTPPVDSPNFATVFNDQIPVTAIIPNACTTDPLDVVVIDGKAHVLLNSDIEPTDPAAKVFLHVNSAGLKGEGGSFDLTDPTNPVFVPDGTKYQVHIGDNTRVVFDPTGQVFVGQTLTRIRLNNLEPGMNDLNARAQARATEDGVTFLNATAECADFDIEV